MVKSVVRYIQCSSYVWEMLSLWPLLTLSPQRTSQNFRHKRIFKASCTNAETYSSTISVLGLDWVIVTFQEDFLDSKNFSSIHLFDLYFLAGNCIWKLSHLPRSQSLLSVSKVSLIIQTTAHSHEYQKQHLMVVEDFYLHRSWNISDYILFITDNEDLQRPKCYISRRRVLKESSLLSWVKDNFFTLKMIANKGQESFKIPLLVCSDRQSYWNKTFKVLPFTVLSGRYFTDKRRHSEMLPGLKSFIYSFRRTKGMTYGNEKPAVAKHG